MFQLKKLLAADEVIICSSLYGAWQVNKIYAKEIQEKTMPTGSLAANIREALKT